MTVARRSFLKLGAAAVLAPALSGWKQAFAGPAVAGPSPYGALGGPDANGVALPSGFTARLLATTGEPVGRTGYNWHGAPDGGACFAAAGGWVYVSNSELSGTRGGAGALKFDAHGNLSAAYAILAGTKWNCAGGATPWDTWLS
jgi:secreted PhoX family phosphatase